MNHNAHILEKTVFQQAFLKLPDPCWVVNGKFELVLFNELSIQYYSRFDGISLVSGINMVEMLPDTMKSDWEKWYQRALSGENFVVQKAYDFQGSVLRFHISFQPIETNDGKHVLVLAKDLSRSREAEEKQLERDRLLDIVFNAASVGISLTNSDGNFVRLNKAFVDILGWGLDELQGQSFTKIFIPEFREQAAMRHERFLSGEEIPPEEWVLKRKDGRTIHLSASISLYNDDHDQRFVVTVISDITEKKKAETALLEAKKIAESAAKAKAEFLSNMSHEIRTPLNAVIGLTDLLIKGDEPEMHPRYIESIKYSADNLLVIVNDILDFSKIESGKIALENIQFSLHKVLEQVMKTMVFKANEKGLKLQLTVQKDVPDKLLGDPYRLNQVLMNLTGNALKFTRDGGIYIDASVADLTPHSCRLTVTVRDTGIGIPESKLDKVFESFTQAYTDTTRLFGGSGLGLAISRNLARLLGGDVTVSSKPGKGSTFTLELPFNRAAEEVVEVGDESLPESPEKADLSKFRFLLVEDNLMNQFVAIQVLKRWKARVEAAENGEIALQMLKKNHYDLVFMDLQMPIMSGYEATTRIRAGEAGAHNVKIPILAMTADALHETKLRVLDTGMDDFITKPLELDDLFTKTVAALKASRHSMELRG